jgi:hypothetical protein
VKIATVLPAGTLQPVPEVGGSASILVDKFQLFAHSLHLIERHKLVAGRWLSKERPPAPGGANSKKYDHC